MTNDGMKETIKKVFLIENDTYIEKIKYKSGFDDEKIYELCVFIKNKQNRLLVFLTHSYYHKHNNQN